MIKKISYKIITVLLVSMLTGFSPSDQDSSLSVRHQVRGNNVFVECILTGISFRESDHTQKKIGKLIIWIDGKRDHEVSSAAFILKELSKGRHVIKLQVVNLKNKPYGVEKEVLVNIP